MAGTINGLAPQILQVIHQRFDYQRDIPDAPASHGNGYGVPGFNFSRKIKFGDFFMYRLFDIIQNRRVEVLFKTRIMRGNRIGAPRFKLSLDQ